MLENVTKLFCPFAECGAPLHHTLQLASVYTPLLYMVFAECIKGFAGSRMRQEDKTRHQGVTVQRSRN